MNWGFRSRMFVWVTYPDVKSASPDETASVEGVVAGTIVLGHATARNLVERFQGDPYVVEFY